MDSRDGLMLWLMLMLSCGIAFEKLVQVPKPKNHERWENLLISDLGKDVGNFLQRAMCDISAPNHNILSLDTACGVNL
jgi:hypothetical protein